MLSVSSLLEFLLNLLRDETAAAEFARDPHATLARHGLEGLCGHDVRDLTPLLADHPTVQATHPDTPPPDTDDPIAHITHLTTHYHPTPTLTIDDRDTYHLTYHDDRDTILAVDDRDTTTITTNGDLTITDSFNQDNDLTLIEDSFNQDNDGIDNKHGTIDHSITTGNDTTNSLTTDTDTTDTDTDTTETTDTYHPDPNTTDLDLTTEPPTDTDAA